jgi:hypothetical protein
VWKFLHWIKICESAWSAEYDFGEHFAYATKFIKGTTIFCQIMDKQSKIEGNKLTDRVKDKVKDISYYGSTKKNAIHEITSSSMFYCCIIVYIQKNA